MIAASASATSASAAMLATRRNGVSPFAGYQVTAFTNDEAEAVGLRAKARWLVEDELVNMGVHFTRGEIWKPYTVWRGPSLTPLAQVCSGGAMAALNG